MKTKTTVSEPLMFKIDDEVAVKICEGSMFRAKVLAVRISKQKVHYDLSVTTSSGVIPFYNIDSVIVTKLDMSRPGVKWCPPECV